MMSVIEIRKYVIVMGIRSSWEVKGGGGQGGPY